MPTVKREIKLSSAEVEAVNKLQSEYQKITQRYQTRYNDLLLSVLRSRSVNTKSVTNANFTQNDSGELVVVVEESIPDDNASESSSEG
jgi:hypothetical protein